MKYTSKRVKDDVGGERRHDDLLERVKNGSYFTCSPKKTTLEDNGKN